jgi:hypothetical protein
MAQWLEFTADYDHRWPSRAVTAFKAGQKVHVKDEVAEGAIAKKRAHPIDKPADDDPARVTTASPLESPREKAHNAADATPPKASDAPGADRVAERDHAVHVGTVIRDGADKPAAER